ncbi:type I-C CRISPR-associated protein Cas7/Csd2 [Synechococcus sp. PCC 6716]|nr:type I-C CRISPR-associated protein Cas7/Csd2 [Synechococcus sp. PCC 6716]
MTSHGSDVPVYCDPQKRHDFVLLFDVTDGNPNGDPDGGNLPRTDAETAQGLVTDVALKRKIRNYVATYAEYEATEAEAQRLKIFVEHRGVLNDHIRRAYVAENIPVGTSAKAPVKEATVLAGLRELQSYLPSAFTLTDSDEEEPTLEYSGELSEQELKEFYETETVAELFKQNKELAKLIKDLVKKAGKPAKNYDNAKKAQAWMCANFYDVRMFGAVMSTGLNAGQVRGPMQLTFGRSLDPILPTDLSITRVAVTDKKDREKLQTMGRKAIIPYGLYRSYGFFSPYLADQTGVNASDLKLFWDALLGMWDHDRSASRGMMALRGLYVFTHDNKLGRAPAHQLFERIQVELRDKGLPPRKFEDYNVVVDDSSLPEGITLTSLA